MVTGLFGPLKDTVLLLKSRGIPVDLPPVNKQPALEFLDSAYMLWDNTVNKAYRVKGEIQPLQNAAADGVRKDITNFGEEVLLAHSRMQRSTSVVHACIPCCTTFINDVRAKHFFTTIGGGGLCLALVYCF